MSNVHDHLWIDIFQHTRFPEQNEKRIWKYRHHLLFNACGHGSIRAVNAIIAAGADICNEHGETLLYIASFWGCAGVVKALIAAGADVNIRDNDGQTPLRIASYWNRAEVVKVLLAAGANANIPSNDGRTPISVSRDSKVRQLLLDSGCIIE